MARCDTDRVYCNLGYKYCHGTVRLPFFSLDKLSAKTLLYSKKSAMKILNLLPLIMLSLLPTSFSLFLQCTGMVQIYEASPDYSGVGGSYGFIGKVRFLTSIMSQTKETTLTYPL